ncbi:MULTISPECIES: class IV adenylate cyclase [unclassified Roseibium]|uniref:class IV adenylate cyclase n=1 Tax=unclassified Roseibium TaxID=2629323 RepID=UPI00273E905F|nr:MULTISPECIES: class IV adenylate cyclase [unclassified Roseibium]
MPQETRDLETKGMLADPGTHFVGRFEVERKFRVADLEAVRQELEMRNAVAFTLGNAEVDIFLDLSDSRLERNNQVHTLRHMQPSGRVLWISKGPKKDECVAMDLPGIGKARSMLKSLGFEEKWKISKKRDIYFLGDFHVTLDVVDGLGSFVEVAAMTDDENQLPGLRLGIQDVVDDLDLTHHQEETGSYRQLLFG